MEYQIAFGRLGMMQHPEVGRRRAVHALIFTTVVSRHIFVWLSFTQTIADVVEGCEAAWRFFGGVFKLMPDNMKPVVTRRRSAQPDVQRRLAGLRPGPGASGPPARVRAPKDTPGVERVVQYVRGNFFAGEMFTDLADAQRRARLGTPSEAHYIAGRTVLNWRSRREGTFRRFCASVRGSTFRKSTHVLWCE